MPQAEEVLRDFGFNRLAYNRDMSKLLGLYGGLYLSGRVSPEDLHEWRRRGILTEKIKEFYYRIPEDRRGQYFPWFEQNLSVLERPVTQDEAQQACIASFYDEARSYLGPQYRDKVARDLEPKAKGNSFHLLAEVLHRMTPNPIEENWATEETMLLDLYQLLLTESDGSFFYEFHNRRRGPFQPVTFTQFWKALETGTLVQLMDAKGLKSLRSTLPFLEDFLSKPLAGPRPSVWDLKQFLEINDPVDWPPCPSVKVDYGFINCNTVEETCILMEVYRQVLKNGNPLELHNACVAGKLFQFASAHAPMREQWRPMMKNLYPLKQVEMESRLEEGFEAASAADADPEYVSSLLSRLWSTTPGSAAR
ncbi:MAG: hypothetical protein Q9162_003548 [Coniocarpon cinnabarinum]